MGKKLILRASAAPSSPITPMPDNPTPDNPTPDNPTPDNPTPDNPTPDNPTPSEPTPTAIAMDWYGGFIDQRGIYIANGSPDSANNIAAGWLTTQKIDVEPGTYMLEYADKSGCMRLRAFNSAGSLVSGQDSTIQLNTEFTLVSGVTSIAINGLTTPSPVPSFATNGFYIFDDIEEARANVRLIKTQ